MLEGSMLLAEEPEAESERLPDSLDEAMAFPRAFEHEARERIEIASRKYRFMIAAPIPG
jgi:hypothetical protein